MSQAMMHMWAAGSGGCRGTGTISPVRVLIVENVAVLREGLRSVLEAQFEFSVQGEAVDFGEALSLAKRLQPDLILLEMALPGRNGIDVLRELERSNSTARRLLLAEAIDSEDMTLALRLGAHGVIQKSAGPQQLLKGLRCALAGQYWMKGTAVPSLEEALRLASAVKQGDAQRRLAMLTPRELEMLSMIVAGHSNPEIASICSISKQTVNHHVGNVFIKLGVSSRLELAMYALNNQLFA